MSVARINQFQAHPGQGSGLRDLLLSFIPRIKQAEGCESCQLLVSSANPDRMVMLEVWDTEEAHQKSVRQIPEDDVKKLMGLVAGPPKGGFYDFT